MLFCIIGFRTSFFCMKIFQILLPAVVGGLLSLVTISPISAATTGNPLQQGTVGKKSVAEEINKLPWITDVRPAPDTKYYILLAVSIRSQLKPSKRERKVARMMAKEYRKMQKKGISFVILGVPHMASATIVDDVEKPAIEKMRQFLKQYRLVGIPCALTVGHEYPIIKLPRISSSRRLMQPRTREANQPYEEAGYDIPHPRGIVCPFLVISREGKIPYSPFRPLAHCDWPDTYEFLEYWEEFFHFKPWKGPHPEYYRDGVKSAYRGDPYNYFPTQPERYDPKLHGLQWRYPMDDGDAESREPRKADR